MWTENNYCKKVSAYSKSNIYSCLTYIDKEASTNNTENKKVSNLYMV